MKSIYLSSHLKCDVEAEEFLHPQMLLSVPLQLQKKKKGNLAVSVKKSGPKV